jgi:competence protein ComEA
MAVILVSALLLDACNGCSSSNPQQVRDATANATATIKNDAKAMAEGVRDGLRRPSSESPLDLNTATKAQLSSLPGVTEPTADRIIAERPYRTPHDLIDRHLLTPIEYNRIADRITVK